MSLKTLMFLTSSLATAGVAIIPLAAQADGMSQLGTWGKPAGMGAGVSNLTCDGVPGIGSMNIRQMNLPRTPGVNTNTSAFRPNAAPGVNANIGGGNASGNIGMSKPLNVFADNGYDWPVPGLGDTLLSYSSLPFEVDGTFISDRRMPSDGIVEALYIVEDIGLRLVA